MSTENRSTDVFSVSREVLQYLLDGGYCSIEKIEDLRELLARPAEQHQGEPVAPAFVMPSNENSYGFGYVDGTCIQSLRGYRDHLEEIVDSIPEGPLYTHADPNVRWKVVADEQMQVIDTLREDVKRLHAEGEFLDKVAQGVEDRLRAQLAEQEGLVKWWKDHLAIHIAILFGTSGHSPEDADKSTDDVIKRAERLAPKVPASPEPSASPSCTWTYNDDSFAWDTTCDESFLLMEDGPKENCMKFCPYCSKPIIQAERSLES